MSMKGYEIVKVKEILKSSGLSLAEISRRTDIKYNTLWCYKSGRRKLTIKAAKVLAIVLKIDWREFFEEEKE